MVKLIWLKKLMPLLLFLEHMEYLLEIIALAQLGLIKSQLVPNLDGTKIAFFSLMTMVLLSLKKDL